MILGNFSGNPVADREDCAILPDGIAVTIDGYTVTPLTFEGGDIGSLCICGSANDLSMRGARPLYIALGIIAEEGFPLDDLARFMKSAADVCRTVGIDLVTGDTKVVPRGQADGLFLTTCAIGKIGLSSRTRSTKYQSRRCRHSYIAAGHAWSYYRCQPLRAEG